jgi:hypothetical protein
VPRARGKLADRWLIALAVAAGAAVVAHWVRQDRANGTMAVPRAAPEALPAAQRPAIEGPREVHLHFHGVTAEDVAAIIAHHNGRGHG